MKTKINEDSLQIEHIYSASVEDVSNCFIDVDIAKIWMAPGKMKCAVLTMDVIPGGKYQITMENEELEQHTATGEYTEVIDNKRFAYTWKWAGADNPETFVEIDFHEEESGCKWCLITEGSPQQMPQNPILKDGTVYWINSRAKYSNLNKRYPLSRTRIIPLF